MLFEKALLGVTLLPLLIGCELELKPGLDEDKGAAGSDAGLRGAGAGPCWEEASRGGEILWEADVGAGRPVLCCSRAAKARLISSRSSVLLCSSDCCFLNVMAESWCGAGLLLVGKLPDLRQ